MGTSSVKSRGSEAFGDLSQAQRQKARKAVKQFTKDMVKGQPLVVILPGSGQRKTCFCGLSKKLDHLRVKPSKNAKKVRDVPLKSIQEMLVGSDISESLLLEGVATPLDELSV